MRPFISLIAFITLLSSCQSSLEPTRFEDVAMTMGYCIQIADPISAEQKQEVQKLICSTFSEVNAVFNHFNPDSFVSRFNNLQANERIESPPLFLKLLTEIDELVAFTDGKFDPTVAPLHVLWTKRLKEEKIPTQDEIQVVLPLIGWHHIHREGFLLWKDQDRISLDLSGIAKGFTVDLLTERFQTLGFQNLYVEWGGEIRTTGSHSKKRPWKIAIVGGKVIELKGAIATSGSYLQNWTAQGKTFTHIIDPQKNSLLESSHTSMASASVICEKCSTADALATTLMLFPSKDEAQNWVESKISEYEVSLIDNASWLDRSRAFSPAQ